MTTLFVSRHPGAIAWAARQGIAVDRLVTHLDTSEIAPGDTVIGSLPVNLAAEVCARGGRYLHLTLRLPPELRGVELSADQLDELGASLESFEVRAGADAGAAAPPTPHPAAPGLGRRLISFLGASHYTDTLYHWPDSPHATVATPYICAALARLTQAAEVVILTTDKARAQHGQPLLEALARLAPEATVRMESIADGKTPAELWDNFHRVAQALSAPGCNEVVLDITHGFRSLSFFATAVVAYHRAVTRSRRPSRSVTAPSRPRTPRGALPSGTSRPSPTSPTGVPPSTAFWPQDTRSERALRRVVADLS